MKSSVEVLSSLERKLNIEVPAEQVQAAFDLAYQNIQKHAAIKGFRKGKAPLGTIRSVYGDKVKQDVIQDLIQKHYSAALSEHSLEPISYPAIEFDTINDEQGFAFSAEFEVRPKVKVTQVDKLPVKKEKFEMSDKFVDDTLEDLRTRQAGLAPVMEDRPAQKGDVAVIDFEGFLLTGPLENGSAQDHQLELGANRFIPGFEENVEGMKPGMTKDIKISFPDDYHVPELAGKPVTFKVTLKELKKKDMPELNDEFAKSLGPYENMDQLRTAVREDYEKREQRRIQEDVKNRILRSLVQSNPVEVPKTLLKEQREALVQDFKQRLAQQGMEESSFDEYQEKWDQDFTDSAAFMIQSSFLIDAIAQEHSLQVTAEDVEQKMKEFAAQTGLDIAKVREFYNDRDRRARLSFQIVEEKVVDFLMSKADVTEVSREELEAENPVGNPA